MKTIFICEECADDLKDVYYFDLITKKNLCDNCFNFKIRERKLPFKEKMYSGGQRFKIKFLSKYA